MPDLTDRQKALVSLGLGFLEQNLDWMNEERENKELGQISSEEIWDVQNFFDEKENRIIIEG